MPRRQDDGKAEARGIEDPFVEENHARAHGDPCRHVEGRVQGGARWLGFFSGDGWVDGGEERGAGFGAPRDVAGDPLLFFAGRHAARWGLGGVEGVEGEGARPLEGGEVEQGEVVVGIGVVLSDGRSGRSERRNLEH